MKSLNCTTSLLLLTILLLLCVCSSSIGVAASSTRSNMFYKLINSEKEEGISGGSYLLNFNASTRVNLYSSHNVFNNETFNWESIIENRDSVNNFSLKLHRGPWYLIFSSDVEFSVNCTISPVFEIPQFNSPYLMCENCMLRLDFSNIIKGDSQTYIDVKNDYPYEPIKLNIGYTFNKQDDPKLETKVISRFDTISQYIDIPQSKKSEKHVPVYLQIECKAWDSQCLLEFSTHDQNEVISGAIVGSVLGFSGLMVIVVISVVVIVLVLRRRIKSKENPVV
ncbi:predicted protein [Naegleria gruberi]|uniref:Predicted protein n=1 Tax=Naegleria gruberi TaxID=5762 RepID=D2V3K5_NAEGR|nr:uncharacterized protein NAEGRDRAFT_63396 [Naegleria gruberi]EFC48786.1 predicted protein [Naegleria gruberi]|eukprot:XP_002681530.1 predicted protein [Naegleria gruberi strain NEG-M]